MDKHPSMRLSRRDRFRQERKSLKQPDHYSNGQRAHVRRIGIAIADEEEVSGRHSSAPHRQSAPRKDSHDRDFARRRGSNRSNRKRAHLARRRFRRNP